LSPKNKKKAFMRTYLIMIVLFIYPVIIMAQDKILLQDGREIYCHVTSIDSVNIHFSMVKNNHTIETMIKIIDVQQVYLSEELPVKPVKVSMGKRNSVDVSVGGSTPRGELANDDVLKEESGLAGNGLSINVNYNYFITPRIGFSVKGIYNSNEYKGDKLGKAFSYLLSYPVINNSAKYTTYAMLFGPTYLLPIDRLLIEGHAGLGFGKLKEPEVNFSATKGQYQWLLKKQSISANTVLYNIGGCLVFKVNDNWDIIGKVEYLEGSFKFAENIIEYGNGESTKVDSRRQDYGVYNISLGLGLKF